MANDVATDGRLLRSLFELIGTRRWVIPFLVLLNLVASLAEGAGVGLLIPLLNVIQQSPPARSGGLVDALVSPVVSWVAGDHPYLALGSVMIGLVALKTVVLVLETAVATRIVADVTSELRSQLSRKLLRMDFGSYMRLDQGYVINLLDAQTVKTSEALMVSVTFMGSLCYLIVFGALLALLSWQMALMVTVAALPALLLVRLLSRRAYRYGESLRAASASLSGRIIELLSAMRTIRILGQERNEERRFDEVARGVRRAFFRSEFRRWSVQPVSEFIYLPVFLIVVGFGWRSGIGLPSLVVFMILLYRMQPHVSRLDYARVTLATCRSGVAEVASFLNEEGTQQQPAGVRKLDRIRREIEFDHVSFSHKRGELPVIQDVSFRISKGSIVAVIGRSGAGKSTLINLLFRLYDPDSGEVRIDGVPVQQYDVASVRERFAFAGQDSDLLIGTVRDNITFGWPAASEDAIRAAARSARAEDFILELPAGYDTEVGPRGAALSGGQRQRIALARALVREPDVLVLDEATSSIDPETEVAIHRAIEQLRDRCTIIVIAHQPATVRIADWVLVLEGGRLATQGIPGAVLQTVAGLDTASRTP